MMKIRIVLAVLLLTPAVAVAAVVTSVGKFSSTYSDDNPVATVIPAVPAVAVSMPLPAKYSSKRHTLLITTTVQESCGGDGVASAILVGGVPAATNNFSECVDNGGFTMTTRTWQILSEANGGTPIAPGSFIDLYLDSLSGTAMRAAINIHAVAIK